MRLAAVCLTAAVLLAGCDSGDGADAAVANNDSVQTSPGLEVAIDVLANDTGTDLTIESFQARSVRGGTVTPLEGDLLNYRPGAGFIGTDQFTYVAQDGAGVKTKRATVTVTVR